jgi:hypothetical protein
VHWLFAHTTPDAVHCRPLPFILPGQQAWPAPPHIPQLPALQVPPMEHAEAAAVHAPLTQQPPPQPFASQHG